MIILNDAISYREIIVNISKARDGGLDGLRTRRTLVSVQLFGPRANKTLHDRLVKELRLAGAATLAEVILGVGDQPDSQAPALALRCHRRPNFVTLRRCFGM